MLQGLQVVMAFNREPALADVDFSDEIPVKDVSESGSLTLPPDASETARLPSTRSPVATRGGCFLLMLCGSRPAVKEDDVSALSESPLSSPLEPSTPTSDTTPAASFPLRISTAVRPSPVEATDRPGERSFTSKRSFGAAGSVRSGRLLPHLKSSFTKHRAAATAEAAVAAVDADAPARVAEENADCDLLEVCTPQF